MMNLHAWLSLVVKGKFTIQQDGTVDVIGDVDTRYAGHIRYDFFSLKQLPCNFGYVSGDFKCNNSGLLTLKGSPKVVGRDFDCSFNDLKSLQHGPIDVGRDYNCSYNKITSLQHAPKEIYADFNCSHNNLLTLKYSPTYIKKSLYCRCNYLITLKHSPTRVGAFIHCDSNFIPNSKYHPIEGQFPYPFNLYNQKGPFLFRWLLNKALIWFVK